MAAPKGTRPPNQGKGRPKGVLNRATRDFRKFFAMVLENNADRIQKALNKLENKDPKAYLTLIKDFAEFAVPKLGRIEVTGADGEPLAPPRVTVIVAPGAPGLEVNQRPAIEGELAEEEPEELPNVDDPATGDAAPALSADGAEAGEPVLQSGRDGGAEPQ
jgi:hypothetical protein